MQSLTDNESATPINGTVQNFIKSDVSAPSPTLTHRFPRGDVVTTSGIISTGTVTSSPTTITKGSKMKFIALLFFFSSFVYSIEPMDDYYAADLLEAVDQAKARPHHYDYSNHYRYKRTTAQSIDLKSFKLTRA